MLTTRLPLVTERTKLINTSSMGIVSGKTYIMGMVFGKIVVETPKYTVTKSGDGYEIREYPPAVAAEVTYDASEFKGDKDGGFQVLAKYIGVFGKPENEKPETIAMTAPVITKEGEKIAMTAPVITKESEKIEMTSPVVTKEEGGGGGGKTKMVTMQFLLPSKYTKAEEAPRPTDERVVIREEGGRKYGVVKFSGTTSESVVSDKVKKLTSDLEKDGFKITGDFVLARYNPPWTLPPFRTNEVMIPVE
ncbi:PREDICTED: heme-binding-like protein At3g10130, chloroplastic isoform X2 [Camelina sativa]|uniref:Heme-binding-like protein At3g10130, chloroplastic n=1 Tax=Camelina sativa TaxID=90675 RepID=A0ABM0YSY0_CAMSA|nr:PREDICTED: heme-binding-like protein At3g10130, chloroplastic [Camelina sativa]XP_010505406.1 PREDICTED: heme-binding-like protein At3g10130, chloroplastic isoform X1 [Camelina sativa]XP_010505407.1 PREDICTED: heme-binding-like protein At3g10130, chloroplastic isoform X2 [Camelina sativa]